MKKPSALVRVFTRVAALAALLFTSGCILPKVYIDPQYRAPALSELAPVNPKPVKLTVTGMTNGKANNAATKAWTKEFTAALQKSKVFILSTSPEAATLEIEINNVGDVGDAMKKGFVTGLTFGIAGSTVTDRYVMTATMKEPGAEVFTGEYRHALHSVVGMGDAPIQGVNPTPLRDAAGKLAEDLFFNFVRDYQTNAKVAPASAR